MRTLRILSVIALVAMLSTTAFGGNPWIVSSQLQVPVVMDIVPTITLNLNGAFIKLTQQLNTDWWEGQTGLPPSSTKHATITSNVNVVVTAELDIVNPNVQTNGYKWGVAIQGQAWSMGSGPIVPPATLVVPTTPGYYMDLTYINSFGAAGAPIPIAVEVEAPDMTVRPPGANQPVATVTLTAQAS
jgi:hypothetical protein